MRARLPTTGGCYLVAVAATAAAFLARLALDRWVGGASPFMTFTLAVIAAAVCGGVKPGLLATALSALAGTYFLRRDGVPGPAGEAAQLVLFALVGGGVSVLCERLHVARRIAEDEVSQRRSSEARKTAILDSALDAVITIDHEGRVVDFNPAAERTFGYSRKAILGREMAEFVIPPGLRDAHRAGIARYLATGEGPVLNRRVELTALRA